MCIVLSESLAVVLYCFCSRTRTCAETLRVVFVVRAVSRLYGACASCLGFPPSRQHMCVCSMSVFGVDVSALSLPDAISNILQHIHLAACAVMLSHQKSSYNTEVDTTQKKCRMPGCIAHRDDKTRHKRSSMMIIIADWLFPMYVSTCPMFRI